jgi:hypothetical protein
METSSFEHCLSPIDRSHLKNKDPAGAMALSMPAAMRVCHRMFAIA